MTIKPHGYFDIVTPDQVAECWEGISPDLYQRLWDMVQHYKEIDREDCGPFDVVGINSVAEFWNLFSEDEQIALNAAAHANDPVEL